MSTYHFKVLTRDQTVASSHAFDLSAPQTIWAKMAKLAWSVGEIGGQIRVTDQAGKLVVLMGVRSARLSLAGF